MIPASQRVRLSPERGPPTVKNGASPISPDWPLDLDQENPRAKAPIQG